MSTELHTSKASSGFNLRNMLSTVVVNIGIPFFLYWFALHFLTSSQALALGIAALFLALTILWGFLVHHSLNVMALTILIGFIACIVVSILTRDTRFFLLRESFVSAALGMSCLLSLVLYQPLMFTMGRQLFAGKDPAKVAAYNAKWNNPHARTSYRTITAIWGLASVGGFILSVILVYMLAASQMVFIGPILSIGILVLIGVWTFLYAHHRIQQAQMSKRQATIPT
jgi:hypothetical protein